MKQSGWNYADVWEEVAIRHGDHAALFHGDLSVSWALLDRRADGLAWSLLDAGLGHQAKVAQYQRNGPPYIETLFAAFKAGFVPVNTNYRYGAEELAYLWTNCDAEAVVFDAEFTEMVDGLRQNLPKVKAWIREGSPSECPAWAIAYEQSASVERGRAVAPWGRSGEDLYLMYTGGTTGSPKGVMWQQHDLFQMLEESQGTLLPSVPDVAKFLESAGPGVTVTPAAPLMHGTAACFVMPALARGGAVATLTRPSFDAVELLDVVVARTVKGLCIVGEPFAGPILAVLEQEPDRWDLSGLRVIFSSGAMLSAESKGKLLRFAPRATIVDGLGSTESGSIARSVSSVEREARATRFTLSDKARVIYESDNPANAGNGTAPVGLLAIGGHIPLGYYGDPEKTAATFRVIDGRRYVVAGDWVRVEADGTITLLGRGSTSINTAGEKVFPEEVEDVLKSIPGIADAAVVGLPHERFGEIVTALVQLKPGCFLDETALIAAVKVRLAAYKAPRRVFVTDDFPRGPNGKLDYGEAKAQATQISGRGDRTVEIMRYTEGGSDGRSARLQYRY